MGEQSESHLGPSSAFTLALVVGLLIAWMSGPTGINSMIDHSLDGEQEKLTSQEIGHLESERARAQSFLALVAPVWWAPGDLPNLRTLRSGELSLELMRKAIEKNYAAADFFHREALARALLVAMTGKSFGIDGPQSASWAASIKTLPELCVAEKNWTELQLLCRDAQFRGDQKVISPLSYLPVLLDNWRDHLRSLSISERLIFVKSWLDDQRNLVVPYPLPPKTLNDLFADLEILSQKVLGLHLQRSRLAFDLFKMDFPIKASSLRALFNVDVERPILFQSGSKIYLNNASLLASPDAFEGNPPGKIVLQKCKAVTLGELSQLKAKSKRALILSRCAGLVEAAIHYFKKDVKAFADIHPNTPFVQVFLPSVSLALKHGAQRDMALTFKPGQYSGLEEMVGLGSAEGRGVIPLVEYHRPPSENRSLHLSVN